MALPEKIHLEIVTPEKQLFSGDVDSLTVPSAGGYMGILPGHAPLLAELGIGEISYTAGGHTEYMFCSWGFLEVLPGRVVILAQAAELASDIDIKRAEEAKVRAEKMLTSGDPGVDYAAAQLSLIRAISRIEAHRRKKV
ncbi:MAG: F0F1 ATP synthase subunit epsilon [Acidobacteria bacterium]|nr:F0F1 ATP synthase subunit epsilon [Acidobacteriota bacterium]